MQLLHALNADDVGAGTADVGAHAVEEVGHVYYVRLLGGVLDDGLALSHDCGHEDIDGGPD